MTSSFSQRLEKTWIPACIFRQAGLKFACPRQILEYFFSSAGWRLDGVLAHYPRTQQNDHCSLNLLLWSRQRYGYIVYLFSSLEWPIRLVLNSSFSSMTQQGIFLPPPEGTQVLHRVALGIKFVETTDIYVAGQYWIQVKMKSLCLFSLIIRESWIIRVRRRRKLRIKLG